MWGLNWRISYINFVVRGVWPCEVWLVVGCRACRIFVPLPHAMSHPNATCQTFIFWSGALSFRLQNRFNCWKLNIFCYLWQQNKLKWIAHGQDKGKENSHKHDSVGYMRTILSSITMNTNSKTSSLWVRRLRHGQGTCRSVARIWATELYWSDCLAAHYRFAWKLVQTDISRAQLQKFLDGADAIDCIPCAWYSSATLRFKRTRYHA